MLQLLLERGQSYEDLAELLGLSVDEVRARARAALTDLAGSDPDQDVGLTDYLLGQADPIGRADAARHLQNDEGSRELAGDLVAKLQVLAPAAELPELPAVKGKGRKRSTSVPASAQSAGEVESRPGVSIPSVRLPKIKRPSSPSRNQARLIAALGMSTVLAVVVVLAIAGAFSGGGGGGATNTQATTQSANSNENLTRVVLTPSGGGKQSGQAVFARAGDQPFMQINLAGLSAPSPGQVYVPWLYISRKQAFPMGILKVAKNGNASGQVAIPQQVVSLLPTFHSVVVSLADAQTVSADLQGAAKKSSFPSFSGQTVLAGDIPKSGATGTTGTTGTGATGAGG